MLNRRCTFCTSWSVIDIDGRPVCGKCYLPFKAGLEMGKDAERLCKLRDERVQLTDRVYTLEKQMAELKMELEKGMMR